MFDRLRYITAAVLLILTGLMFLIPPTKVHAQTLEQHIAKFCKSGCVDAPTLVKVADQAAKRFNVDKRALLAIVHVESKYHIKAVNGNSVGLTQVLLRYHRSKFPNKPGKQDYYNVQDNVFAGAQVFRDCLVKHKQSYPMAFRCYNGYHKGDPKYKSKTLEAYKTMTAMQMPAINKDHIQQFLYSQNILPEPVLSDAVFTPPSSSIATPLHKDLLYVPEQTDSTVQSGPTHHESRLRTMVQQGIRPGDEVFSQGRLAPSPFA